MGVKALCRSPGLVRGVQGWRGCRFCRRGGFRPQGPPPRARIKSHVGGDRSATEHDQSCRWVKKGGTDVLDTPGSSKDGAFTDFLAKSSLSARLPPAPATPASSHERGGGIGARLMHRVRAELQGEHDGRVCGAQGQALLMSGGGWYERPGCVRLLAVTSVTGRTCTEIALWRIGRTRTP